MTTRGHISLHLTEASNPYQQLLKSEAASAATRGDHALEVTYSHLGVVKQIQQLFAAIQAPPAKRPRGIVVLPARDGALDDVAREAGRAKIAWIVLNRRATTLGDLPSEFPELPIFTVTPDDRQIGSIQAKQLRTLLPNGGRALYVRGLVTTLTAVEREASMTHALTGSAIELEAVDGGWTLDGAKKAVALWLRSARSRHGLSAIACQNDAMAVGALRALESIAAELDRPELLQLPVLGCDGLPTEGRRLVDEKKLAATVTVPLTAGVAVDLLLRALDDGTRPPLETALSSASYPELDRVGRRSRPPSFPPRSR